MFIVTEYAALKAIEYIQSWKQEKNILKKWIILPRSPLLEFHKTLQTYSYLPDKYI